MKQIIGKSVGNMLIGAAVGAIIVGGAWYATFMVRNHGGVIAKVGNNPISHSDFLSQVEKASGSQTLTQLINNQLVEDGAAKYHITVSQSEMDTALKGLEQQSNITSDAQLQAVLSANHVTMAELQKNLRTEVLEQKLSERNVTVSDKEIQDYYDKNKSQMAVSGHVPALKDVKGQISDALKQSKALSPQQLMANLAKEDSIQILDPTYASVKTSIENPAPAQGMPGQ